jgi:hypothetical protein
MKQTILLLCLALPILAADPPKRLQLKATPLQLVKPVRAIKIIHLPARTIKLEFKLKGPEEVETFLVLSTGGKYAIGRSHSTPDFEHSLDFSGEIKPNNDARKASFTYSVTMTHEDINEGNKGLFTLTGSAVLKSGRETLLGRLGDQDLMITATVNE